MRYLMPKKIGRSLQSRMPASVSDTPSALTPCPRKRTAFQEAVSEMSACYVNEKVWSESQASIRMKNSGSGERLLCNVEIDITVESRWQLCSADNDKSLIIAHQAIDVNLPNKSKEAGLLFQWPGRLWTHESLLVGLRRRRVFGTDIQGHDVIVWIWDWTRAGCLSFPQHTPVTQLVRVILTIWVNIHDMVSQLSKESPLQWFSKEIRDHFQCWAMFNCKMLGFDLVLNEEVTYVHVVSPFRAGLSTVLFDEDRACIVLI